MVAGRLPFDGSNKNEIMASVLSDKEPLPLARYAREVPSELERIVAKALHKDREQRYQTIKDMLLDLKSLKQHLEFKVELERSQPPEIANDQAEPGAARATVKRICLIVFLFVLEKCRTKRRPQTAQGRDHQEF